jgi:transposase
MIIIWTLLKLEIYFTEEDGKLKGWNLFGEIKQYKEMGLNKSQVQRTLNIGYNTVNKYWNMSNDEYAQLLNRSKNRTKKIDKYQTEILEWITDFRDISAAQVLDWIRERYGEVDFRERSLRHYICNLRKQYALPKAVETRQFEEVPETPIGFQAQVDMGQIWLKKLDGSRIKVYCFAMVLSHSRFKYILWSDRPFTTLSFIDAHNKAFEYIGGMPKEIVYDQDRVLVVSENSGDIIYTEGFQNYINMMKYKVRLCRGFDPQSKGYVKISIM